MFELDVLEAELEELEEFEELEEAELVPFAEEESFETGVRFEFEGVLAESSIEAVTGVVVVEVVEARRFLRIIALTRTQMSARIITPMITETRMIFFFETDGSSYSWAYIEGNSKL